MTTTTDRYNGLVGSVAIKPPVRVATTANITLSGLQTIDGIVLAESDRVLVKNQTNAVENGIYVASLNAWSRATDFNGAFDAQRGTLISTTEGLASAYSLHILNTASPIIGTSSLYFSKIGTIKSVMDFGAVGDGGDDTQAFHDALASGGRIYTPPLTFAVGNVLMPSGAVLYGNNGIMYNEVANPNATILKALSGADCVIDVSGSRGYYLSDVILDGVDSTIRGLTAITSDSHHGTITRCSTTRCSVGFGGSSGKYLRSTMFIRAIAGNGEVGFADAIDSYFTQIVANANSSHGMSFTAGESSNSIDNSRIEWNGGDGISIFGASRILMNNINFDSNYKAGLSMSGALHSAISNCVFARNSRDTGLSTEKSHISIGGSCDNIAITGCVTRIGSDDGGGGVTRPDHSIEFASGGDTSTNITIVGNNLQGHTVSAFSGTFPTQSLIIRDNQGAPDLVIGQDINCSNGRIYQSQQSVGGLASGASTVFNMTNQPVNTSSSEFREINIWLRLSTTVTRYTAVFKGVLAREAGTAYLELAKDFESGAAGAITINGGGGTICDLAFGNFSTDGSTFDITVTNNHGSGSINVKVELK